MSAEFQMPPHPPPHSTESFAERCVQLRDPATQEQMLSYFKEGVTDREFLTYYSKSGKDSQPQGCSSEPTPFDMARQYLSNWQALSNPILWNGVLWPTIEHAFQWNKIEAIMKNAPSVAFTGTSKMEAVSCSSLNELQQMFISLDAKGALEFGRRKDYPEGSIPSDFFDRNGEYNKSAEQLMYDLMTERLKTDPTYRQIIQHALEHDILLVHVDDSKWGGGMWAAAGNDEKYDCSNQDASTYTPLNQDVGKPYQENKTGAIMMDAYKRIWPEETK